MKRYLLICQLALLYPFNADAQFTVGSESFFIKENTDVYLDGLTLKPTTALTLTNKTLTISGTPFPGSPPGIARVYNFNDAFSFEGRLGLFYQASDLNGNVEATLQVVHKDAVAVVTTGSVVNTTTHYIYNDLAGPMTFKSATAAFPGALPVTLIDFTAKKEGGVAQLSWSTSYETNSNFFEIQRSRDTKNWLTLNEMPAWRESRMTRGYDYTDNHPEAGANFYRLKMVDKDGSFALSKIRDLTFTKGIETTLYPNPVLEKLKIKVDDWHEVAGVKLFNNQGKTFFESANALSAREIDMKDFPSGIYMVQVKRLNGSVQVIKVIKQ
ncbi:T9SS type A sorting domain-containing protein [Dyadobacter sp. LHD-138]|uniref:T9SS type A sorting domain-containing protein n=1 Tax=Dyadobacter sp. LHD-138 TaxID=3071413 RepID=UPI0027E1F751|nr:T9SS type A sorting domain-containing protein [Dyadobacter sp. LHD-138]MDQ6476865.1 T9SS type A sorting domain-containing protein [Dyadobacter sp. LHD-138]